MKRNLKNIALCSLVLAFSCSEEFSHDVSKVEVTSGDANFTTYVAIGNSLTSGYSNGALYLSGQENSYPAIIANQMKAAGGGEFTQPYMLDDVGGFSDLYQATHGTNFYGKFNLELVNGSPSPVPEKPKHTLAETFKNGLYNNVGVPGAKSFHLIAPGYGNPAGVSTGKANPYFARFASSPNTTVIADAMQQKPTFFTLWIGNNDILSYASSGGVGTDQKGNLDATTYSMNDLSDPKLVGGVINTLLTELVEKGGAKGAIANIPNVADIPFFTTVPSKPFNAENPAFAAQIKTLNEYYSQLNQVYDALGVPERKIYFDATKNNGAVVVDESLKDISAEITGALVKGGYSPIQAFLIGKTFAQVRQSNENDLFLLTTARILGQVNKERADALTKAGVAPEDAAKLSVNGVTYPIQDSGMLTPEEITLINERTTEVNAAISAAAGKFGLALVDANAKMKELKRGIYYNGVNYTTTFVTGGAFSLDGVHLTPRGYAIIANEFIQAINKTYNSTLSTVEANDFPGIQLP